jgi:hypothetical protein
VTARQAMALRSDGKVFPRGPRLTVPRASTMRAGRDSDWIGARTGSPGRGLPATARPMHLSSTLVSNWLTKIKFHFNFNDLIPLSRVIRAPSQVLPEVRP